MGSYLASAVLATLFTAGLIGARPLVCLNIRFYSVLRPRRFAGFWQRRKDAHVAAVRVTCALVLAVSLLEMIFRRAYAG